VRIIVKNTISLNFILILALTSFMAGLASASTYINAPYVVLLGDDVNVEVASDTIQTGKIFLRNPSDVVVSNKSVLINGTATTTFSNIDELGNWTLSLNYSSLTHMFAVVQPSKFKILPLESNHDTVNESITVALSSTSLNELVADENISLSGTVYAGSINETEFNCDVDGSGGSDDTMLYFWISDPDTAGTYNMLCIDDDNDLTEATETGKTPKLFLREYDAVFECTEEKYNNESDVESELAPFMVSHISRSTVLLTLPPGPGDVPYNEEDLLIFRIFAFNKTAERNPVSTSVNGIIRYKNPTTGVWSTLMDLSAKLNPTTNANGLSNEVQVNLSGKIKTIYSVIINDIATYPFEIEADWDVKVIIGDPITQTENYYFELNDAVAFGIVTDASSPTITINIYDPDGNLDTTFSGSDIDYESADDIYLTATDGSFTVDQAGKWTVDINIKAEESEKIIKKEFKVKAYELMIGPIEFRPGDFDPEFGQIGPGSQGAYVAVLAFRFGIEGGIESQISEDDVILIDEDYTDSTNLCYQRIMSIVVKDSDENTILTKDNFTINNLYNITTDNNLMAPPEQYMLKQCMAKFNGGAPTTAGEYSVEVTLNLTEGEVTNKELMLIKEIDVWAQPWDMKSKGGKWQFAPGANVTIKLQVFNLYTGEEINGTKDVKSVRLLEVFNEERGIVTNLIESYGLTENSDGAFLWIKTSNQTSGFHHVEFKVKAEINDTTQLKNATGIGYVGFVTKLYDVRGHPNFDRDVHYFGTNEVINLTVEVYGPNGPVSDVNVIGLEVGRHGVKEELYDFSSTRGTTDENGQASVSITNTAGDWEVGDYFVKLRVKDDQGTMDYGHGWFEVRNYRTILVPVSVSGGNCTEREFEGPITLTGGTADFLIGGIGSASIFKVTPDSEQSKLYQFTNLNGEPLSKEHDLTQRMIFSTAQKCTLSSKLSGEEMYYLTLNTSGLDGDFELSVVVTNPQNGQTGITWEHLFISPYSIRLSSMKKGEPVYAPGDVIGYKIDGEDNITNAETYRLFNVMGKGEMIRTVNKTSMPCSLSGDGAFLNVTIPNNLHLEKGEYIVQLKLEINNNVNITYSEFFMLKPFTYGLARILRSWGGEAEDNEQNIDFHNEDIGSKYYESGTCPFPQISGNEPCGLINITHIRANYLDLWPDCDDCIENYNGFVEYYNLSGDFNELKGFYLIVGTLDKNKLAQARVYVARTADDLNNENLTAYEVNDIITDDSGAEFEIYEIKDNEITLRALTFARNWEVPTAYVNATHTLSGRIKLGVIREDEVQMDFNGDNPFEYHNRFGLPYALFDLSTANTYDTVRVDQDLDLNLTEETESSTSDYVAYNVNNKKVYFIKADRFDTIFAMNEPGQDDWLGTHRTGTNITVPLYSDSALNLSASVLDVINDETQQFLVENTDYYQTPANFSENLAFVKVQIQNAGRYRIVYQIENIDTGETDVAEPWKSPFVEVRSFDAERDIVTMFNLGNLTTVNSSSSMLGWLEEDGSILERLEDNASIVDLLMNNLPAGFDGFARTNRQFELIGGNEYSNLYRNYLFNRSNDKVYISDDYNFSDATAYNVNDEIYSWTGEFPTEHTPTNETNNPNQTISVSVVQKQCFEYDCNIVIRETQSNFSEIEVFLQPEDGYYRITNVADPFLEDYLIEVYKGGPGDTNISTIIVYSNFDNINAPDGTPLAGIGINASGQPNETTTYTITGKFHLEDWCVEKGGCIGGDYNANLQIVSLVYINESDNYILTMLFNESYSARDWFGTKLKEGESFLELPDNSDYYLKNLDWKGIWLLENITDFYNPTLFISTDSNFSNKASYSEGEEIPVYDRHIGYSVNYKVLALAPKNYGEINFTLGQLYSDELMTVNLTEIISENQTRFSVNNLRGCEEHDVVATLNQGTQGNDCMIKLNVTYLDNATGQATALLRYQDTWAKLGFDRDNLSSATKAILEDSSYEKRIGVVNLSGAQYTVIVMDTNANGSVQEFTEVIVSNDSVLESSEEFVYSSGQPVVGNYYLARLEDWRTVLVEGYEILNIPYSWDGAGYMIGQVTPETLGLAAPFNQTGVNYTIILFDDREDGQASLEKIAMDDDIDFARWEDRYQQEIEISGETYTNYSDQFVDEGYMAECDGELGSWFDCRFDPTNSDAYSTQQHFDMWDEDTSEELRIHSWIEWWALGENNNLTFGLRVRGFNGSALTGTVETTDIWMEGMFGYEWEEFSLNSFDSINYTAAPNPATLDNDGVTYINIKLIDGTKWMTGMGYRPELVVNASGISEQIDLWFNVGSVVPGGGGG
jgi:hypothetical protein